MNIRLSYLVLTIITFVHLFFVEDTYGYDDRNPDLFYIAVMGLTLIDLFILLLFLYLKSRKGNVIKTIESRRLYHLLGLTLAIAYGYAAIQGNLFGFGTGSGFKELRSAIIMCLLYYCMRKSFSDIETLERFHRSLVLMIFGSALFYLLGYLTGITNSESAIYGHITTFEGPLLMLWSFGFACVAANASAGSIGLGNLTRLVTIGMAIILSNRRTALVMALGMLVIVLLPSFKSRPKTASIAVSAAALLALGSYYFLPTLVDRINPFLLFDESSSEYLSNLASNVQHINDIILGYELVREHPVMGLGPGAEFISPDPDLDLVFSAGVHMQYFYFWLKLGLLGVVLLLYFYYIQLKYSMYSYKISQSRFCKSISLAIFAFCVVSALFASMVGLNIYGTNKLQFLTIYVFVAAEIVYMNSRKVALLRA